MGTRADPALPPVMPRSAAADPGGRRCSSGLEPVAGIAVEDAKPAACADPLRNHLSQFRCAKGDMMALDIPGRLRDDDFAVCLVKRYLAADPETGRAHYS